MKLQKWDAGMICRIYSAIKAESGDSGLNKLIAKEFGISESQARRVRKKYAKTPKQEASCI